MKKVETTVARQEFAETVNQVAYGKKRVVLQRRGRDMVAMVPLDDLATLRQCEEATRPRTRVSRRRGSGANRGARASKLRKAA
jgi:PHD/YefM family antitoxin component YafN of YafNO toxin-antitoxin module